MNIPTDQELRDALTKAAGCAFLVPSDVSLRAVFVDVLPCFGGPYEPEDDDDVPMERWAFDPLAVALHLVARHQWHLAHQWAIQFTGSLPPEPQRQYHEGHE